MTNAKKSAKTLNESDAPTKSNADESEVELELVEDEAEVLAESEVTEAETEETKEAESKPASVPLGVMVAEKKKKQEAEARATAAEEKLLRLEREQALANSVLQPQAQAEAELIPPHPDDYLDQAEWTTATAEYNRQLLASVERKQLEAVQQQIAQSEASRQQATEQAKHKAETELKLQEYYERADKLGAPDFLEAEEKLLEVWSPEFLEAVKVQLDNSEQVVWALSKDSEKAAELAKAIDTNMVQGGLALLKYAGQVDPLNQTKADLLPEPDEPIQGGAGGVTSKAVLDKKIATLRELNASGQITMTEFKRRRDELLGNA